MVGNIECFQSQRIIGLATACDPVQVNKTKHRSSTSNSLLSATQQQCQAASSKMNTMMLSLPIHSNCHFGSSCLALPNRTNREELFFKRSKGIQGSQRCNLSFITRAEVSLAAGLEVINDLGLDTLTFLVVTVFVVPTFKSFKASPILGFFIAGFVLNQLNLIRNIVDIKALSELGILFLLFEMGLELSLARLKALAKFAFGMGFAQVLLSTLAFTAFELPPNNAIGTRILEFLFHSRPDLVNIRTIDEAVVIGAALSMSSSAFVLQLLADKGELPTRFGSATLGILLFQDIAVVPLLVILPILESGNFEQQSVWPILAAESLKALGGLGALSLGGQLFIRRIFEVVADSRSSEAFNALCLLTVTGTSLATQKLGFSDTLGAFLAGALLAETNFRTQIEAEIRPFRGLLLGLFFVTTGTSIDIQLLLREWPNVLTLLGGLITIKTAIITAIGPFVGLSMPECIRIGFLLSQGGEFAFVVFSLANRLGVLPSELNRLLIIVVVLSMSLTPFLNEIGQRVAEFIEARLDAPQGSMVIPENFEVEEPVVIIGFGEMGQVLANFLSMPLASGLGVDAVGWKFIAFDLDPARVKAARKLGFPVLYGDGSRPAVLQTAGINMPKAVMVMYTSRQKSVEAVERLRLAFHGVPIYARAKDLTHLLELKAAGATDAIFENAETSLQLGSVLLRGLGVLSDDVSFLTRLMRESMELRARVALEGQEEKDDHWPRSSQAKIKQTLDARIHEQTSDPAVTTMSETKEGLAEPTASKVARPTTEEEHLHGHESRGPMTTEASGDFVHIAREMNGSSVKHAETPLSNDIMGAKSESEEARSLKERVKSEVAWHQRMRFTGYDGCAVLDVELGLDENIKGVTWCALHSGDDVDDSEEDSEAEHSIDQTLEYYEKKP